MTTTIPGVPTASVGAVKSSFPIDFSMYDANTNYELYFEDEHSEEHILKIDLENTSGKDLVFPQLSASTAHFELRFRKGTLSDRTLAGLKSNPSQFLAPPDNAQWTLWEAENSSGTQAYVSLYLRRNITLPFGAGQSLVVTLQALSADAGVGARGTRVEFVPLNITYTDQTPITGSREQYLMIAHDSGQKYIPLHFDFVGTNRVLNDGATPNTLTLRMTNISRDKTIAFNPSTADAPTFILDCDIDHDWGLVTTAQIAGIAITCPAPWQIKQDGQSPVWKIYQASADLELPADEAIQFSIMNIITGLPAGFTNLYLSYYDIPGYWDGDTTLAIEKTPLIISKDNRVGFGHLDPNYAVSIEGSLQILNPPQSPSGNTLIIGNTDGANLRLGHEQNYSWIQAQGGKPLSIDSAGGLVGIGPGSTAPEAVLHLMNQQPQDANGNTLILGPTASANLRLGYAGDYSWIQSHGAKPLVINQLGNNVGIGPGNTAPEGVLHIMNQQPQDANGNTLIIGPTNSANLRLGYAGDYSWIQSHGAKPLAINQLGNNVGIGITNPTEKLVVNGRIKDQTGYVMPVGSVIAYLGATAPDGWLLCNGSSIPNDPKYAQLRQVLNNAANLPNLTGRSLIGSGDRYPLAKMDGEETHTLTVNEIPSHTHNYHKPKYDHGHRDGGGDETRYGNQNQTNDDPTVATGGGQAHNNMPPYYVVNYIVKY